MYEKQIRKCKISRFSFFRTVEGFWGHSEAYQQEIFRRRTKETPKSHPKRSDIIRNHQKSSEIIKEIHFKKIEFSRIFYLIFGLRDAL